MCGIYGVAGEANDMAYEEADKSALRRALFAMRRCPNCRGQLLKLPLVEEETTNAFGCVECLGVFAPDAEGNP